MIYILAALAALCLIIGSITDIKTREVPDFLNFSLIAAAAGVRIIYSLAVRDIIIVVSGILGFAACLLLALAMYYTGQWGGGDAKMLMAIGAVIGLPLTLAGFPVLGTFIINILIVGAVYGILYSTVLALRHWKRFAKEFKNQAGKRESKYMQLSLIPLAIITTLLIIAVPELLLRYLAAVLCLAYFAFVYLFLFVRSVERSCMYKSVAPEKLTEGDWIAKPVVAGKKTIIGKRNLGVTKEQISELVRLCKEKKISTVVVKEGIPFIPSFLIAYLLAYAFGAWFII